MTKISYYIKTFGCQMNTSDSERIAGFLESHKFKPARNIDKADLIVFNTCGVRQSAEDRVYGQINNLRKLEIKNVKSKTKKIIILTGCLANRKDVQKRLKDKVNLFCEIQYLPKFLLLFLQKQKSGKLPFGLLISCLSKNLSTNKKTKMTYLNNNYLNIEPKYSNSHIAYVPIMTGCDNFCSYCIVPYVRGREVSRPADKIIKEVKGLVKKGCREIVLLGQNVNSYKSKIQNSESETKSKSKISELKIVNFSDLLKTINAISGNFWIRFMTSHPKDMSDELIKTIAQCEKVCEHVHLPIQAGDDEVLRRMNRKYTAKYYLNLIKKIKEAFAKYKPDSIYSITTDIIVGFPGETKKQFLKSAEIMREVKYDMVYFGRYSPRPGTASWKMKDNVSSEEKERREKYLNEILKKTIFENNQKYVGKILEVLVESYENGCFFGRTKTGKNVKIHHINSLRSKNVVSNFNKIEIIKANVWNLEGKLL